MHRILKSTQTYISLALLLTLTTMSCEAAYFSDVSPTNLQYQAIEYLRYKGSIGGYSDGTFKPNKRVNKAEALKITLQALGISEAKPSGALPFSDIKSTDWFTPWIISAYNQKIITGNPDGTFNPGKDVNRAELLKMIFMAAGEKVSSSSLPSMIVDVKKESWYAPYIAKAIDLGMVTLTEDGFSRPEEALSRGSVAFTVYSYIAHRNKVTIDNALRSAETKLVAATDQLSAEKLDAALATVKEAIKALATARELGTGDNILEDSYTVSQGYQMYIESLILVKSGKKDDAKSKLADVKKVLSTPRQPELEPLSSTILEAADVLLKSIR